MSRTSVIPSSPPRAPDAPGSAPALTTGTLARRLDAELRGPSDLPITGLNSIDRAAPGDLTFIRSDRFARAWASSRAVAALVSAGIDVPDHDPARRALLIVKNADLAVIEAIGLLSPPPDAPAPGIHPSAVVHASARIGPGVSIGPLCVVERDCRIGAGTVLRTQVTLDAGVAVGERCLLEHGVRVLNRAEIGSHCTLHSGVVIGTDGFGYRPDQQGRSLVKVPHLGGVRIEDHVEIGANSCIDRARFGLTIIGAGTKLDNLCHIAHNCTVGRNCVMAAQSGLAGSVTVGDWVQIGGNCGIAEGMTIGDGARLGGMCGVMSDVPAGATFLGAPAGPIREFFKSQAYLKRFADPNFRRGQR